NVFEELKGKLDLTLNENESQQKHIQELENELNELRSLYQKVNDENKDQKTQIEKYDRELNQTIHTLRTHRAELDESHEISQRAIRDNQEKQNQINELQEKINVLSKKEEQLFYVSTQLSKEQQHVSNLQIEIEKMNNQLNKTL